MVEYSKIKSGLMTYVDQHLMPKLDKQQQFLAGLAIGLYLPRADEMLDSLAQSEGVKALGLMGGGGVDLERVYEAAKAQIRKQNDLPLNFPLIGRVTLSEADIDDLYRTILNA